MDKILEHILCIDDEDDILQIEKLSLEDIGGLRVSIRLEVKKAIEELRDIRPDLVMIDMMMPFMSGIDAIAPMRGTPGFETLPIILVTARAQPDEVKEYLARGANAVITKPFDPMVLADQVRDIWSACAG